MKEYIVAIDGGTSNTRLRLLEDGEIIDSFKINVGASAIDADGRNDKLASAMKETVDLMIEKHKCEISCFLGSGMITSTIGLLNIPHLDAPFEPSKVTFEPIYFKDIHSAPFYFVSGVKFLDEGEEFFQSDLVKGEETEVYGILKEEDYARKILVVHFGTHNKAISVENGKIVKSITTIGGELLNALISNTIIKNSVCEFDQMELEDEYVLKGFQYAVEVGLSRSLFLSRVGQVLYNMNKNQVFSFVYGIMAQSDFLGFKSLLEQDYDRIITYGQEGFGQAFAVCFKKIYGDKFHLLEQISHEESELLSVKGLYTIYSAGK